MTNYYMMADSFPAAERTARDWARLQPRSAAPWLNLHALLSRDGRRDEAIEALRRAIEFEPGASDQQFRLAFTAITTDDYREADRLLLDRLHYGAPDARRDALWWLVITSRNEGRLRDALTFARRLSALADSTWSYEASLATTQVLFEMGRHREAARLFDSLANEARSLADRGSGVVARNRAWRLTHSAASWAAVGDTSRLAPLADSIEAAAHLSAYGRDWRLPGHVRGLLWMARGQPARAAVELRGAIYSPTDGYTRTNLELGRVLLALGKPHEAVAILQPALRGPVDASNLYVTRTEIHELLAHAFAAAGQRDSATTHYRKVAGAWRDADRAFRARSAAAAKKATMR
jgi:tetratricopeptide (TPR) repeat protein